MVGGFVCKKGKQEGSFWKRGYKGWGSLVIRGKVGGFWAKDLLLPPPTPENRGGGPALAGGAQSGDSGPRRRPGPGGKGGVGLEDPVPGRGSGRGGPRRPGHGGGRR